MGPRRSLRQWVAAILPDGSRCSQKAAHTLVRALLVGFNTQLGQLARQTDGPSSTRGVRQYFTRWLNRKLWEPPAIYAQLPRLGRHLLGARRPVLLLIDTTDLCDGWVVLQVSVPWQRRALLLWRGVYPYSGPGRDQVSALAQALEWLGEHLPGDRGRYVLVMDRGFPSNPLITELQAAGWRFVLRVKSNWRMEHRLYTGQMRHGLLRQLDALTPRLLRDVLLGSPRHGKARSSRANRVQFWGEGHLAPWFLVTSEGRASTAVAMYRERMRIEQEFRDLKGPLGLDRLASWLDQDRLARFLAWVAVYEWRLAYLWCVHDLASFAQHLKIKGDLSWIRTVREWIQRQIRLAAGPAPTCL